MKALTSPLPKTYDRISIQFTNFEDLAEMGHEVGDDGAGDRALYASLFRRNLLSRLTSVQRRVVICLNEEGMTRKTTARHLMVSVQEIHQVVARIKRRFPEEDERLSRRVAMLYWLIYPTADARTINYHWKQHPVLRDYRKPDLRTLVLWRQRYLLGKEELDPPEPN